MNELVSIDEFDWSATPAEQVPATPASPEQPAPEPPPTRRPRRSGYDYDRNLLPQAYRDYEERRGRKNVYKRAAPAAPVSIDDFDWGGETSASTYDPRSDWDITRGAKVAYTGGREALEDLVEMQRVAELPPEQQLAEMLKERPVDPSAARLQVPSFSDIGTKGGYISDAITFALESAGQMFGSVGAAAVYGGGPGAAAGAVIGGGAGALGLGVGAAPGALAGGASGAAYGTLAAFPGMGVGSMYRGLLSEPEIRKGLQDGTIDPETIRLTALGTGLVIGALDAYPAARRGAEVLGIKEGAKDIFKQKLRKAVVSGMLRGAREEAVTETIQGTIEEVGRAALSGDPRVGERIESVINQGLVGFIGGAAPGAIGGIAENARLPRKPETAATVLPPGTTATPTGKPDEFKIDYGDEPPGGAVPPDGSGPGHGRGAKPIPPKVEKIGPESYRVDYGKDEVEAVAAGTGTTVLSEGEAAPDVSMATDPDAEIETEEDVFKTPAIPVDPDIAAVTGQPQPRVRTQTPTRATSPVIPVPPAPAPAPPAVPPVVPAPSPRGRREPPPPELYRTGQSAYVPGQPAGTSTSYEVEPQVPPVAAESTPAAPAAPEPVIPVPRGLPEPAPVSADELFSQAVDIVDAAERDLGPLTDGQRHDLLLDQLGIDSTMARDLVAAIAGTEPPQVPPPPVAPTPRAPGRPIPPLEELAPEEAEELYRRVPRRPQELPDIRGEREQQARLEQRLSRKEREADIAEGRPAPAEIREEPRQPLPEPKPMPSEKRRAVLEELAKQLQPETYALQRPKSYWEEAVPERKSPWPFPEKMETTAIVERPVPTDVQHMVQRMRAMKRNERAYLLRALPREVADVVLDAFERGTRKPRKAPPRRRKAPRTREKVFARAGLREKEKPAPEAPKAREKPVTKKLPKAAPAAKPAPISGKVTKLLQRVRQLQAGRLAPTQKPAAATKTFDEYLRDLDWVKLVISRLPQTPTNKRYRDMPEKTLKLKLKAAIAAEGKGKHGRITEDVSFRNMLFAAYLNLPSATEEEAKPSASAAELQQLLGHIEALPYDIVEGAAPAEAPHEAAYRLLRRHFAKSRKPVRLGPLGFTAEEIAGLEKLGMAEDGSMDAAEFGRWEVSRRGAAPTPSGREPSPERPVEKLGRQIRYDYKKPKPRPVTAQILEPRLTPSGDVYLEDISVPEDVRVDLEKQRDYEKSLEEREAAEAREVHPGRQAGIQSERGRRPYARGLRYKQPPSRASQLLEALAAALPEEFRLILEQRMKEANVPEALRRPARPIAEAKRFATAAATEVTQAATRMRKQVSAITHKKIHVTPGEILSSQYDRALERAKQMYIEHLDAIEAKEKAAEAYALEQNKLANWEEEEAAEEAKVRRETEGKPLTADQLAEQNEGTVRRKAREEAAKQEKQGGSDAGLDKFLLEISRYYDRINEKGTSLKKKAAYKARIQQLTDQRVEARRKEEAGRLAAEKEHERIKKRTREQQKKKARRIVQHMLDTMEITEEEAADLLEGDASLDRLDTRFDRGAKTVPALQGVLKATELPLFKATEKTIARKRAAKGRRWKKVQTSNVARYLQRESPVAQMEKWATALLRQMEDALRAAGVHVPELQLTAREARKAALLKQEVKAGRVAPTGKRRYEMPTKGHQTYNSIEENVYIFIRSLLLGKRGRGVARSMKALVAAQKVPGKKPKGWRAHREVAAIEQGLAGRQMTFRGYNLSEAVNAVFFLQKAYEAEAAAAKLERARVHKDPAKQAALEREEADWIKQVNDMIFDESKTAGTALRGQGMGRKESEAAYRQEGIPEAVAPEVPKGGEVPVFDRGDVQYMIPPAGFELGYDPTRMDPVLISEAEEIVRQVTGYDRVQWRERMKVGRYMPSYDKVVDEAMGGYYSARDVIEMVLSLANPGTAFHEAFHRLQNLFLTDAQHKILLAETERLRAIVAKLPGRAEEAASMKPSELQAEAFRAYATGETKVNGRLAVVWAKLKQAVRRVHNLMMGRGMKTSEDIFRAAIRGEIAKQERRTIPYMTDRVSYMANPFDTTALGNHVSGIWNRLQISATTGKLKATLLRGVDTETLKARVGKNFFGGNMNNPFTLWANDHMGHKREVEQTMNPGDLMDNNMLRWAAVDPARQAQLQHAYDTAREASLDRVDPTQPVHAKASEFQKAAHARYAAEWAKVPADLKAIMEPRIRLMTQQMKDHDRRRAEIWLQSLLDKPVGAVKLPNFMTFDNAVTRILTGKLTPGLEKALGKNADTIKEFMEHAKISFYVPAFRVGDHFISGRLKIPLPAVTRGRVAFDQNAYNDTGVYRFEFTDEADRNDYEAEMGRTGEHRVLRRQTKWVDPATGLYLPRKVKSAVPRFYLVMQNRFMAMSDDVLELQGMVKDMRAGGQYEEVSDVSTLESYRNSASMVPLALKRMLANIDSMTGMDEAQKKMAKTAATNAFIQTQHGSRLIKNLVRRQGVHGYETGIQNMFRSFNSHNEMMSRHKVSLDRLNRIREHQLAVERHLEAMRSPAARAALPPAERDIAERDYAKHGEASAELLSVYVKELNRRSEEAMTSSKPWPPGETFKNLMMQITTMAYLGSPSYYAIQMLGWMQSFQRMAARHGIGMAYRQMVAGYHDTNAWQLMGRGMLEGWAEARQLAPGSEFRKTSLFRESEHFVERAIRNLIANGTRHQSLKIKALRLAQRLGALGQAGLDQPNLTRRALEEGGLNTTMRNVEQMTRVFRALQEGVETVNRIVPIVARIDIMMDENLNLPADQRLSEDEIVQRAVNEMSREQTNYSSGNWAGWADHWLLQFPLMFKKFAAVQAMTYYEALHGALRNATPQERSVAIRQILITTALLGAVGGLSGNPLWEPVRMLLYLAYALGLLQPETWDETKASGEGMMAGVVGDATAEYIMYGLPRAIGVDVSSRVAMDNLVTFQQPEQFDQDNLQKLLGAMLLGAPGAQFLNSWSTVSSLTDKNVTWAQTFAKTPAPKFIRDIAKAYDQSVNGINTATGIDTGIAPNIRDSLVTAFGFRTRQQARPYEVGSVVKHKTEERVKGERNDVIQRAVNNGMTAATMRDIAAWNRAHPDERIRVDDITRSRRNRRRTEKEIRAANEGVF